MFVSLNFSINVHLFIVHQATIIYQIIIIQFFFTMPSLSIQTRNTNIKTRNTASEPEYSHRFHRCFKFLLSKIDLPKDCKIIQPIEHDIVITFVWNQIVGREVQLLENSYIRVIDTGIRIKWQQSPLTPEWLSNLLVNMDRGKLKEP